MVVFSFTLKSDCDCFAVCLSVGCWGRQGVIPAVPESEDWWSVRVAVPVDTPYQYSWLVLDPATGVATHTESVLRNRWTPPPGKSTVEEIVRLEFLPQSFKGKGCWNI